MTTSIEKIKVVDLGEACALFVVGFPLISIEKSTEGNFKEMEFEEVQTDLGSSKDILDLYRKDKLVVKAREHFIKIKELKSRMWLIDHPNES